MTCWKFVSRVIQFYCWVSVQAIELVNSSWPHLDITGIGATACCHGFFVPTSVVDFQKGERYALVVYVFLSRQSRTPSIGRLTWTIITFARLFPTTWKACSWPWSCMTLCASMESILFMERVEKSPGLSIPFSLELHTGIELFQNHGHQDSCLPQFPLSYISLWATFLKQNRLMERYCENATYKGALDHRGYKGTAEEDIRLRVLFLSSAGYNHLTKLLPKEETRLGALYSHK